MDLNDTAVFVKVVEAGSFTEAARRLGIPVSTVSNRVARLEKDLQATLLRRTTRRMHLTEAGQVYFDHAAAGLDYLLAAREALSEVSTAPVGRLRVSAPVDVGDHILAAIVRLMREQHPKVDLEFVLTNRYVDLVAEGIDVAIRTGRLKDSSLIAKRVGMARWVLFASRDYLASCTHTLKSPEGLRRHRCLQFTPMGKGAWTFTNGEASVTVPLSGSVMVNDVGVIHAMLLKGEGVALLPTYLCRGKAASDAIVPVLPEWTASEDPISMVFPRQQFMPPKLRAFIDIASQEFRERLTLP
ncbi:LysR family transcriptional regulator [Parahaliea mediterranea]|uniref:LysR family transcriptional regulator n=1 Tax=Parahaliea mediterranea TaxID=651086 RepID=UPI000E2E992F|nr:LysR family transcriptional regulator [Parahaliea mediterranea]